MNGNLFVKLFEVFLVVFLYTEKLRALFLVLFFVLPLVYYFINKHSKISCYSSKKTIVLSTVLGVLFGIGICSALGVLTTASFGKYPIELLVHSISLAVSLLGYTTLFLVYLGERMELGRKCISVDFLYSVLMTLVSARVYVIVFEFAEKVFGGIL